MQCHVGIKQGWWFLFNEILADKSNNNLQETLSESCLDRTSGFSGNEYNEKNAAADSQWFTKSSWYEIHTDNEAIDIIQQNSTKNGLISYLK